MSSEWIFLGVRITLALLLYGFLAAILIYLWRDFRLAEERTTAHPQAHLRCLVGANEGEVFSLGIHNEVGRAADNSIRLDEPTVSAYHARLSYYGGQWWLEDLGSKNGTMLNEIHVDQTVVVTYEDEISFGKVLTKLSPGSGEGEAAEVTRPADSTEFADS